MRKLSGYGPSLIVLATAIIVLLAGPKAVQQLTYEQTRTRIVQASHNLESNDILLRLNQAYGDIATVVEPSVVHVSAQYVEKDAFGERIGLSTGSGWIFDSDGHVVTNHHVVQNSQRIDVQLYNGELREADILGADPSTDIAVLKIAPARLHPATIADLANPINQGDLVFAFGSPFDFRFSMSSGVVSGKDRSVGVLRDDTGRSLAYQNFIQVDAAINPGNSGGPLTDFRGHVIGMNTAIATNSRRSSFEEGQFAGIGLAIPMDMILPVVTQIIEKGYVDKGFLGVNVPTTPDDNTARLRQLGYNGTGVVITNVYANEAAAAAGVRESDVVTHVNSRAVSTIAQLQSIVSSMQPGESAKLTVWRREGLGGASSITEIAVPLKRLDPLRAEGRLPADQPHDSILPLGIARMSTSTPEKAAQFGVTYHEGVLIEEVTPNSTLSRRVGKGSILTAVSDNPVRSVDDLLEVLGRMDDLRTAPFAQIFDASGKPLRVKLQVE